VDQEGAVDENDALIGDYWVEASTSEDPAATGPRSRALSATNILGAQVYNRGGEEVGELQNLVLDFDKGQIVNTVFATGGILGLGEDEYLLPWKSFSHSREEGRLLADITKEKVESSPRYDEEDFDHERSDATTTTR
jgi:sporulation protein YlmC with PRC-barrel domain